MVMYSYICLPKLVQNRSGSFGINSRYLSHHLAIISMIFIEFSSLSLLCWTDLRWTTSFIIMVVVPVLASSSLVSCSTSWIALCTVLISICNPVLLQKIVEVAKSISITCIESVPSELSHLALSHKFDFFHLSSRKLHLSWVDCSRSSHVTIVRLLSRLHITIIVIIIDRWRVLFGASSLSILLGYSSFELMDSSLLKFLSHYFFLFEPGILLLSFFIHKLRASTWGCRRLTFAFLVSRFSVWSCHVKHHIIKIVIYIVILLLIVIIATSCRFRWILQLNINHLIILEVHVFFDEI
jgi:hypothetical protein